jgi:putative Mg2+ transporter-C (MgtC) family protein
VAGIVTGIGFLGAGAIIRIGDLVRGLTTAACIWFTAALGVVIGGGRYILAVTVTALILVVLVAFEQLEHRIRATVYRKIILVLEQKEASGVEKRALALFREHGVHIQDCSYSINMRAGTTTITFQSRLRNRMQGGAVVKLLSALPGVCAIDWQ